jgi:hypothetical protein
MFHCTAVYLGFPMKGQVAAAKEVFLALSCILSLIVNAARVTRILFKKQRARERLSRPSQPRK